jgi:hypothetical protein
MYRNCAAAQAEDRKNPVQKTFEGVMERLNGVFRR